jgi:DNA-binding transcriptional MocR family regulator
MSSFSKILAPGLRVGWGVVPAEFSNYLTIAKQAIDLHASSLSQRIVIRYLAEGRRPERLDFLREQYRQRRNALHKALFDQLGNHIDFNVPDGGMFLWGRLKNGLSAATLLNFAIEQKVVFVPGAAFYSDSPDPYAIRLSFATITPEMAREAAIRLSKAIDQALASSKPNIAG